MPMPRTHFLIGIITVQLMGLLGTPVTILDLFLGGLIAILLEADHIILYWKHHKNFNFVQKKHNALESIEEKQSFLHHWNGWVLFLFIAVVLAYVNKHYAILFLAVLTTHQLLDHESVQKLYKKRVKSAHFLYPKTWKEWSIDIACLGIIFALLVL